MKVSMIVILAIVLFSNVGILQAQSTVGNPAVVRDPSTDVLAAAATIVEAFGRNDREAYFVLFDPSATFIFYTTPHRLNDRMAYEQEWRKWEKESGFRVRSCSSTDQRVQLFGDTAIFTHSVRTEISTNQGNSTLHERETIVFHRNGERWVAVHEHLSSQPE